MNVSTSSSNIWQVKRMTLITPSKAKFCLLLYYTLAGFNWIGLFTSRSTCQWETGCRCLQRDSRWLHNRYYVLKSVFRSSLAGCLAFWRPAGPASQACRPGVAGKSVSHHHHHSAWQRTERWGVYGDTEMTEVDWAKGNIYWETPGQIELILSYNENTHSIFPTSWFPRKFS